MLLFLDTTDLNSLHFALLDASAKKGGLIQTKRKIAYEETHKTLELLAEFLKTNKINLASPPNVKAQLSKVICCSGPGSFTGTRVGVTIAQALGFAWKIPVIAIAKNKLPKNLKNLAKLKTQGKILVRYSRPAV